MQFHRTFHVKMKPNHKYLEDLETQETEMKIKGMKCNDIDFSILQFKIMNSNLHNCSVHQ